MPIPQSPTFMNAPRWALTPPYPSRAAASRSAPATRHVSRPPGHSAACASSRRTSSTSSWGEAWEGKRRHVEGQTQCSIDGLGRVWTCILAAPPDGGLLAGEPRAGQNEYRLCALTRWDKG